MVLRLGNVEGGSDGLVERSDNLDDAIGFGFGEDAIESFGMEIRERRLIEQARIHDALLGQVVDDGFDEADLVSVEGGGFKVLGEAAISNSTILPEKTSYRLPHLGLKPQAHNENPLKRVELIVNCAVPNRL
jgi:hypothetical protein